MISIAKISPDGSNDSVLIKNHRIDSRLFETQARVSKTKTLDGGVVVVTGGFVEEDMAFIVNARMKKADVDILKSIYKTELYIIFSCEEGVFTCVIDSFSDKYGDVRMRVEVSDKLSA